MTVNVMLLVSSFIYEIMTFTYDSWGKEVFHLSDEIYISTFMFLDMFN